MSVVTDLLSLVESELCTFTDRERTIAANMLRRKLDELDPPKPIAPDPHELKPLTSGEAAQFEADAIMFGKHIGTPHGSIPREYLAWLCDEKRAEWRQLRRYLMHGEKIEHDDE